MIISMLMLLRRQYDLFFLIIVNIIITSSYSCSFLFGSLDVLLQSVQWLQVDHWLNKRPFDAPAKAAPKPVGRVLVIGAGPAGLAAARHLQVTTITFR